MSIDTTTSDTSSAVDGSPRRKDALGVFGPLYDEHDYVIEETEGALPAELVGTLYRNGPGRLESGGSPVGHLFDGDGMLSMFAMGDRMVRYRNRYVRTQHFAAGRSGAGLPARTSGAVKPGGLRANAFRPPANPANTHIVLHAGQLLALCEVGRPYAIDPDSLETLTEYDFDGQLHKLRAFSAHPKLDPRTGELFNFGLDLVPTPRIHCYRIDPRGRMHRLHAPDLPAPAFNHDFALTQRHLVFVSDPLFVKLRDLPSALLGRRPYDSIIEYRPERGTTIALVPRDGGRAKVLQIPALMHFHISNAYDDCGDTVVELVSWREDWRTITRLGHDVTRIGGPIAGEVRFGGDLIRLRITPSGRVIHEHILDVLGEFPQLDPRRSCRRHRFTYLAVNFDGHALVALPNAIAKIDHDTGATTSHRLPEDHQVSEPIFVPREPRAPEGDGWLIAVAYQPDQHRSRLLVLDARDIESKPVFTGYLHHHVPFGFHGTYTHRVAHPHAERRGDVSEATPDEGAGRNRRDR